jgi:hypothetical protein
VNLERFRGFAITMAVVASIFYCVSLYENWPLFTFLPATRQFVFFRTHLEDVPVLDWYGTVVSVLIVGALAGLIVVYFAPEFGKRLPPALAWIVPLIALAVIFYLDAAGY